MKNQPMLPIFIASLLGGAISGAITNFVLEQNPVHAQPSMVNGSNDCKENLKIENEKECKYIQSLKFMQSEGFLLRDKQGKARATLSTRSDGTPELKFYNEQGDELGSFDPNFLSIGPGGEYKAFARLSGDSLYLSDNKRTISLDVSSLSLKEPPYAGIYISDDDRKRKIRLSTVLHDEIRLLDNKLTGSLEGRGQAGAGIEVEGGKNRHVLFGLDYEDYPFLEMNGAKSQNPSFILKQFSAEETTPTRFLMGFRDPQGEIVWNPQTYGKPWLWESSITQMEWLVTQWQADYGDNEYGDNNLTVNFYLGPESIKSGTIYCDLNYWPTASAGVVDKEEKNIFKLFETQKKIYHWLNFKISKEKAAT